MSVEEQECPPWDVSYRVDKLTSQRASLDMVAAEADYDAMAVWLKVDSLKGLRADVQICRPKNNHLIYVSGTVYAEVTQSCVRSLNPVVTKIAEPFDAYYSQTDKAISFEKGKSDLLIRHGHDEVPMLDESDDPEPVVDGVIHLGELVMQFLALAVPLYPKGGEVVEVKASGVSIVFDDEIDTKGKGDASEKYSPFQELASWRSKVQLDEDGAKKGKDVEKDDKK
jgi:uncharacterized metal-binding protein YceD (DUF177 family)|tara:strand:- start:128063 stop:128737 length:675 start_codon:yes stop_codon:yes gene_type:complete